MFSPCYGAVPKKLRSRLFSGVLIVMRILDTVYGTSLALMTDLYQLTASYVLWKENRHETKTVFHYFHRSSPFQGGFAISAGLQYVTEWVENFKYSQEDLLFLSNLRGNDGEPLFQDDGFLKYLESFRFECNIDAMPEGTPVFPYEPTLRATGSIVEQFMLESACLCFMNFSSLAATKAVRVCDAAEGDPVIDFGLRRAQGLDGALIASRALYIGGAAATSNLLAGKLFGIPVKGTHQHAFVMFFDSEVEALRTYGKHLPNNVVFLVDTYGTLQGVKNAITVSLELKQQGFKPIGIRLDSGDLAYLSCEARKLLDAADLREMQIVASNDLDEHLIKSLKQQGATIAVWGVGTKLITCYDQPAFGGVYKLGAVEKEDGTWEAKIKVSEQLAKTTTPGILGVRRFYDEAGMFEGDMIYCQEEAPALKKGKYVVLDPLDGLKQRQFSSTQVSEDLLVPTMLNGRLVGTQPTLEAIRARCKDQVAKIHPGVRRFINPHQYPAGLDLNLHRRKVASILNARNAQFPV